MNVLALQRTYRTYRTIEALSLNPVEDRLFYRDIAIPWTIQYRGRWGHSGALRA